MVDLTTPRTTLASPYWVVITTIAPLEAAKSLAMTMVEQGLCACAQMNEIESLYYWDDQLQQDKEYRLLFKTTASCYAALMQTIRQQHPYTLPAIYAHAVNDIEAAYASWVDAQYSDQSDIGR